MLVKFHSSAAGELILFAGPAGALLHCMGKATTARGVITEEQIPAAITAIESMMHQTARTANDGSDDADGDAPPPPIDLARRAVPLVNLLRHTMAEKGFITWEAPQDF